MAIDMIIQYLARMSMVYSSPIHVTGVVYVDDRLVEEAKKLITRSEELCKRGGQAYAKFRKQSSK